LGKHEFSISDPDGGNQQLITMEKGGSATLPDGSVIVLQETTQDVSKFMPGVSGAAAQAAVHLAGGQHNSFVIYADNPPLNRMNLPLTGGKLLQYRGGQESVYTGLQVAKDPGVWVVWLGCLMMLLGIFVAFLMSHRRIWVRVENQTVTIAGNASKDQGGFQLFLERFVTKLKNQLSSEERK
jgi:cytochrome c biogenesis protein